MVSFGYLLVHSHSFAPHFPHDLSGFLVFEVVELISFLFFFLTCLLLSLFFLLHNDFIPHNLFKDNVVEDSSK